MRYRIYNLEKGLFQEDVYVEANNPKNALKKIGYVNIIRDYEGTVGNIVVYNNRGSYIYHANMKGSRL